MKKLKHKILMIPQHIRHLIKGRETVSKAKLRTLFKVIEMAYNEAYRKNPTQHETLQMEGQLKLLKLLIDD